MDNDDVLQCFKPVPCPFGTPLTSIDLDLLVALRLSGCSHETTSGARTSVIMLGWDGCCEVSGLEREQNQIGSGDCFETCEVFLSPTKQKWDDCPSAGLRGSFIAAEWFVARNWPRGDNILPGIAG